MVVIRGAENGRGKTVEGVQICRITSTKRKGSEAKRNETKLFYCFDSVLLLGPFLFPLRDRIGVDWTGIGLALVLRFEVVG